MTTYIGYTRWKKLKKICFISKSIINTYGLRYFFYVVNLELKKQGLSFLKPDAKPISSFENSSFKEQYQNYLKRLDSRLENEIYEKKFNLSYTPTVLIILIITSKNFDDVNTTINSIKDQTYSDWKIILISKNTLDEIISNKINEIIPQTNSKIHYFQNNLDASLKEILSFNGDFFGFIHSGDRLSKFALYEFAKKLNNSTNGEIFYSDHDEINQNGIHQNPFFKPDWSPYLLRSIDYLSPFYMIKKNILQKVNLNSLPNDCFDFDILLRSIEIAKNIIHIPLPLCSKNINFKKFDIQCHKSSLENHLQRTNIDANVIFDKKKNIFRIKYNLKENPKVSIIIPTKNNYKILKRCIESIEKHTNYKNFEILIVDNASDKPDVKKYYEKLSHTILSYDENFNFSKMNNLAVKHASGNLLLFLNDDTKVLDPLWLDELVSIVLQKDVGAVGPKLIFSDSTIQHAGMVFLKSVSGFHPFMRQMKNSDIFHNIINSMRDYSSVTGACILTKKEVFEKIGGFDDAFDVYYGDADLCLKIIDAGYRIIYTPFTELLHEGSFTIRNSSAFQFDVENHYIFSKKWQYLKKGDPYYNPNLDWDCSLAEFND